MLFVMGGAKLRACGGLASWIPDIIERARERLVGYDLALHGYRKAGSGSYCDAYV